MGGRIRGVAKLSKRNRRMAERAKRSDPQPAGGWRDQWATLRCCQHAMPAGYASTHLRTGPAPKVRHLQRP